MFRLRMALSTLALFVGLGSASQAQMFNQGMGVGFGVSGFSGGFQQGFGGFQSGFGGQPFGMVLGVNPSMGAAFPYGNGYGYGVPYYPSYGYYAPPPQTYNSMGSLMDSIQSSTSRRGGWRGWP